MGCYIGRILIQMEYIYISYNVTECNEIFCVDSVLFIEGLDGGLSRTVNIKFFSKLTVSLRPLDGIFWNM